MKLLADLLSHLDLDSDVCSGMENVAKENAFGNGPSGMVRLSKPGLESKLPGWEFRENASFVTVTTRVTTVIHRGHSLLMVIENCDAQYQRL